MKKGLILTFALSLTSLFGCSALGGVGSSYTIFLNHEEGEFKVLQLADLHWNISTNIAKQKKYLDKLVEVTSPHLIVLSGDQFMGASKDSVTELFTHLETYEIPYAPIFGNHDFQGVFTIEWFNEELTKYPHNLFKLVNDSVNGYSNYVINLTRNDVTYHQIYLMDSGSYDLSNPFIYTYNYMGSDQVDWYKQQAENAKVNDTYVPSSFYYHIPIEEFGFADSNKDGLTSRAGGYNYERICPPTQENNLFEEAKARNAQGMFVGHEHSNAMAYIYDDVMLAYGVKTTRELYYSRVPEGDSKTYPDESFDLTGGALLTISNDGTYDYEDLEYFFLEEDDLTLRREKPLC